ncbi:unnamed protein product [Nippostrongylus brasiliensis]|uniref:Rab3 GTPase-activating protein regulatory subunit (inferred by orthology to a C. elegans protein) n=1 Tax=Nippostrongylus brasiliensis TaxID=27835 RepID=A0A158QYT6_NIPBR|nr:unnamed protein product [Nippostrongylus brasiliensis]
MAVSFTLEQNLIFNKELADKVKNYLLGGDQEESHRFIKRTVSISSEDLDGPDPEEPAGVRDWEFAEQVQPTQKVPDESPLDWLSLCCLVTYNSLDYILLVNQQRFALLTRTASNEELEIRCLKELDYQLGFAKEDNITCGCLFGLGTHRVSEPLDCLIIALGMSNGHVVFFTERGTLLFFEQFSESDILWVTFDQTEDAQQLTIVTAVDFFAVDPISLHSTLLKAKTAIAKGEKTAEQLAKTLEVDVDRLRPEKVKNGIRHVLFTGTHQQSAFEQYATASMASYNETISAAEPPMYSTYLYTSDRVFSTFAWTSEADRKKIWSDAIKYGKSFVPSFGIRDMLGISTKPRKKTAVAQTSHVVTTRATLDDARLAMEASGVRVGAVHVDPAGVLLDGGMQSVLCGSHNSELRHDAFFADSQGRFYRLVVPFRLSMLRVTSQDQHDQLLLSKFSSSPSLDSFMDIYGLLRMLKSKRELILMMLPLISDPSKLEKLLDNIPKSDAAGPVEELLAFVRRQLNVYCRLIKYGKQPKAVNGELHESHFNAEVQEIINRHCSYGESDQRPLMNIGEFLAFVDCRSTSGALWERNYPDVDMLRFGEFVFDRILQGQEDFCDLICFMFIRSNLKMGAIGFSNLCEFIAHVEDRHPGSLEKCERAALDSTNLSRGLLLFAACCLVRKRLQNKSAVATEEPMETDDNEENSLLNAFLTSKLKQPMPFSKIVTCARAFFREQIASLAARERWQPDELMEKLLWNEDLKELHSLLPNSLQESLLCCDIAWELMSLWFKGSSEHFDNFELALKYLEQVNDSRLRHGVVVLMWQNFILERFKAAIAQLHPPASLQISGASRDSLVELAIRQPLVNYHLVLHHYHLAVAAAIQLSSGIRSHILRNLFCPIGQRAFFHPLDSHPLIPLDRVDDAVVERRHQFLAKVAEQGTETDRTLAKVLSCEWNLTVDTIQITQVLCYLRAGDDRAASREMPEIGQTDRLLQTMTRILAARVLRLVEEEKTWFVFLNTVAGEENVRVDWPDSNWKDSLQSFGRILSGLHVPPQYAASFIRISGITAQYWGINIMD